MPRGGYAIWVAGVAVVGFRVIVETKRSIVTISNVQCDGCWKISVLACIDSDQLDRSDKAVPNA
jgi:hypothetical protein